MGEAHRVEGIGLRRGRIRGLNLETLEIGGLAKARSCNASVSRVRILAAIIISRGVLPRAWSNLTVSSCAAPFSKSEGWSSV